MLTGIVSASRFLLKIFTDTTTLADGVTFDVGRILVFIVCLALISLSGYDLIVLHNHFSAQEFGIGFGSFAAGAGALLSLKAKTEPDASPARRETAEVATPGESVRVTTETDAGVKS